MKTHFLPVAIPFVVILLLAGCSKEPHPSKSDIEQSLTTQLPAFARVSSFSVDAMQNLGTQVEPAWNARFHATVKVTSDTFTPDGMDAGVIFVRAVKRDGEATEMFGKSISRLYAGTWRTSLEFDGQPIPALGMPESAFAPKKLIVCGSKAETDYLAEQAEKRRQAIAAAQRETEERRAAAMREAEQSRAAEERAIEERRKMLANAPKLLIGTWRDENSLLTYFADGTRTGKYDNGDTNKSQWQVDGDILTRTNIEFNGRLDTPGVSHSKIIKITSSQLTVKELDNGGKEWRATRVK
jgi:hypothetical protein